MPVYDPCNPYDAGEDVRNLVKALDALIPLPESSEGNDGCSDWLNRAYLIDNLIAALDARYGKTAPTTPPHHPRQGDLTMPVFSPLPISHTPEAYLGDGVYASFDGDCFTLDLRGQEPTLPITKIVLEPPVLRAFQSFVTRVTEDLGAR